MNKHKRLTSEYQQELQEIFSQENKLAASETFEYEALNKARTKITIEPFSADPSYFDPSKHDFVVYAHKDGDQIGMMAVTHKKDGIMPYQFHVEKEYRRSKVGTTLANKAEEWAKKDIIPSPDMTEDAKKWHAAWQKLKKPKKIKKSEILNAIQDLVKSDAEYTKKAGTGVVLMHPVSISGKTHRKNGIQMHMTVKFFGDNTKIDPKEVEDHLEKFSIPKSINENKMLFMPHKFPSQDGGTHHVLLVYGAPSHIHHVRKGSEKFGTYIQHFLPHIAIDKEDWDRLAKIGPVITAEQAGIKINPAELRSGAQTLKHY